MFTLVNHSTDKTLHCMVFLMCTCNVSPITLIDDREHTNEDLSDFLSSATHIWTTMNNKYKIKVVFVE